jgi:hypothetical protein
MYTRSVTSSKTAIEDLEHEMSERLLEVLKSRSTVEVEIMKVNMLVEEYGNRQGWIMKTLQETEDLNKICDKNSVKGHISCIHGKVCNDAIRTAVANTGQLVTGLRADSNPICSISEFLPSSEDLDTPYFEFIREQLMHAPSVKNYMQEMANS